jgi:flagellar protein FliS
MAVNVQQTYQQNSVITASPQELTLMLYNAGIKFLKLAKIAIENNQKEEAHKHIIRVQDILTELELGLNPEVEISKNMAALYDFMKYHLIQANIKKDIKKIDEVLEFFEEFRNTWKQAMELAKKQRG